jgi:hypothetical protein
VIERFWSKVQKSDGCWLWTDAPFGFGYGRMRVNGRNIPAHRLSAMIHFGMFDRRLYVLHHCDTPLCVRPEHLYLGTAADNVRDKMQRGRHRNGFGDRTHCKHGHEFTEENTYSYDKGRACRTCHRQRQADYRRV